ncbi:MULTISPECIES: GlxA family transcriptional regulator [unclassified Crossiella]|uniref:GlxA family transcriptional regulator n=1 Tax=unclassified Crossiella TaxID=2620835 RepID=UPI001FFF4856|nr:MULTISPECIES: helix-turn-helix domain-containing protein [unclassified Crossiella]MCK2241050.1 helix-turn-helix domain-containing protein [Crossiella sp. S99.2]MCK2253806.1 helix-turn-helix domain-containing protein [Crossiella sp. S99.1]
MARPHRVAVLTFDHAAGVDLGVPPQVFGTARDEDGRRLYEVRVCTPDGGPVWATAGYQVHPQHGLEAFEWADTVVACGVHDGPIVSEGVLPEGVGEAFRAAVAAGKRVMSICTGAFALAAAGLLDGRPATTHWWWVNRFRRLFPEVRLNQEVLFVDDGQVLTSAGVAAGLDLCLHVVRLDHGSSVANRSARRCVVAPWRDGGQAQFIERPLPVEPDSGTTEVREWMLGNLEQPLELRELAGRARMSVRTFTRRFREETGLSPGQWLVRQRVELARRLLEETDLPVDRIARQAGFGTSASLRAHLRSQLGTAPSSYRRTFRQTG